MRKIDLTSFSVATSETARSINRRIILDLIRTKQPISRAELARLSGLQRSTISIITDQLLEEQWVTQGAYGQLPRGRKPRFLHLNVKRVGIIGVNIRPTTTTIALANINAQFTAHESFPTSSDPKQFIAELSERLSQFISANAEKKIEGVGVSVPGRVDLNTKKIIFAPNLGWRDVDIKTPIERLLGVPVEIENAANACALAEIWFDNRAAGIQDLMVVTISEGIGTGIITNGQLVKGSNGAAGEFGHVTIERDHGKLCKCGNHGCWEVMASNTAAVANFTSSLTTADGNNPAAAKRKSNRRDTSQNSAENQISFDDIIHLAEQSDVKAKQVLAEMGRRIGEGLAMLITGMAPELIVVIGEVTQVWDIVKPEIDESLKNNLPGLPSRTRIIAARDDLQPRLRGSVALILQKHFGAPLVA